MPSNAFFQNTCANQPQLSSQPIRHARASGPACAWISPASLIDFSLGKCVVTDAEFRGATFRGDARFGGATFHGDARFGEATFRDPDAIGFAHALVRSSDGNHVLPTGWHLSDDGKGELTIVRANGNSSS